jgi:hypothetical protein
MVAKLQSVCSPNGLRMVDLPTYNSESLSSNPIHCQTYEDFNCIITTLTVICEVMTVHLLLVKGLKKYSHEHTRHVELSNVQKLNR